MSSSLVLLPRSFVSRYGAPIIARVDMAIFRYTYFTHCLECSFCHDQCCEHGVDVDLHHVERIESVGQPFDPSCHEAMMQQPAEDQPPDTILEEYQPGYRLWNRVLRPAKVVVAKAIAEAESDRASDDDSPADKE